MTTPKPAPAAVMSRNAIYASAVGRERNEREADGVNQERSRDNRPATDAVGCDPDRHDQREDQELGHDREVTREVSPDLRRHEEVFTQNERVQDVERRDVNDHEHRRIEQRDRVVRLDARAQQHGAELALRACGLPGSLHAVMTRPPVSLFGRRHDVRNTLVVFRTEIQV